MTLRLDDLQAGSRFKQYTLIEKIGAGGQGVVWSARTDDQSVVAIKLYEIPPDDTEQASESVFMAQADQIRHLSHPFVLPTLDIGVEDDVHYLITPYMPGDTLHELIRSKPLSTDEALRIVAAIAAALDYLHGKGVIHRDLKPGNVLLDLNGGIYLADFGLARLVSQYTRAMHTGRGTPPYSPPEQHSHGEITAQSDIFSLGVILYELFTRGLPWEGERSLGLELLYDRDAAIPDPREANPDLPEGLVQVLRKMTALSARDRLQSGREAFLAVCAVFGKDPKEILGGMQGLSFRPGLDARKMADHCLNYWDPRLGVPALSLTRFIFTEKEFSSNEALSPEITQFFLQHALMLGWREDAWWLKAAPKMRIKAAELLLWDQDEDTCTRVIYQLRRDPSLHPLPAMPERLAEGILRAALRPGDPFLRQEALQALGLLLPTAKNWKSTVLGGELDSVLARLAVEDAQAARLVGQLGDRAAVESIIRRVPPERLARVLAPVMQAAGNLPDVVPLGIRIQMYAGRGWSQITAQPKDLRNASILSFVGSVLGLGGLAFITFRLMDFMDTARFLVSLERGLFLGFFFAAGIMGARLIMERLVEISTGLRLLAASLLGGLIFYFAFFLNSILFLSNLPGGYLMPAACLLAAAGFALAGLARSRWAKALIAGVMLAAAIAGSWLLHLIGVAAGRFDSPLIFFEYTWGVGQALLASLGGAVLPAVLGCFQSLRLSEGKPRTRTS